MKINYNEKDMSYNLENISYTELVMIKNMIDYAPLPQKRDMFSLKKEIEEILSKRSLPKKVNHNGIS